MAIASVNTLTLLNAWQRRMDVPIWHYNQVTGAGVNAPLSEGRADVWVQNEREFVAEGIRSALGLALPYLRYYPRPVFLQDTIKFDQRTHRTRGLQLRYGFVQAIGARQNTLVDASAAVVYSPGVPNAQTTATISVTVPVDTDPDSIRVYFASADRPIGLADTSDLTDDRWQIEPLQVNIVGTAATITGHRALFVSPAIWADPYTSPNYNASSKNKADTGDVADFVTVVSVYIVQPDPTATVTFLTLPGFCPGATTVNGYVETPGVGWIEDERNGVIGVRPLDMCYRPFHGVRVHYYAGKPTVNGEIERGLQVALIRLGNCEMPQEPTAWSDERLQIWQKDTMVATLGGEDARRPADGNSPFGPRQGQLAAWRYVSLNGLGVGGAI